ncbi:hypothetical protein K440DRAFT_591245 [Wilcoxina mikolae CBS 423.85]|nr:hypothetical protein K440DRAFT_591245 [Wilcoxina mikolae CBS 423.85]
MASSTHTVSAATRIRSREGSAKVKESNVSGNCENGHHPSLRLKVVIRHLPSLLKRSEFCNVMSNYINDQTTDFFAWDQGKIAKDRNKSSIPSRCYVKMKYPVQITGLSRALRAHGMFTDGKGNSTLPQIEFSPFQRIPKEKLRFDSRSGTIESDSDFQAFLASLNPDAATPTAERGAAGSTHLPALEPHEPTPILAYDPLSVPMPLNEPFQKPKTTPLIEYIRGQKVAPESSSLKTKMTERSSAAGNSRSAKRSERRTSERASKPKAKEIKKDVSEDSKSTEPMALLKRTDSVPARPCQHVSSGFGSSTTKPAEKLTEKAVARPKETGEKGKCIDRDRQRSGVSGVVAILQRDLGLSGSIRRSRGRAAVNSSDYEPATSITPFSTPLTTSNLVTTQHMPVSPKRQRGDRPSRRERRAAKLETAEPTSSISSFTTNPALASTPLVALGESSSLSAGSPVTMITKHQSRLTDNSSAGSSSNPSPLSDISMHAAPQSVLVTAITATPTGPRGGFRGSRGRNRRGIMAVGNPKPTQPQANPTTPTRPDAENGNIAGGGFGGRGRGGQGGVRVGLVFAGARGTGVKGPGGPVSTSLGNSYVKDATAM